jgi:phosphate starvation-inducible protein PhoH and related proteins
LKNRHSSFKAEPKELSIQVVDPEVLKILVGERDANLRDIQKELEVTIGRDRDHLVIAGQDAEVDLARDVLVQLKGLIEQGQQIFEGDVVRAIHLLSSNRKARLEELLRDQVKVAGKKYTIAPKTFAQKAYVEAAETNDLVFGIGPAGSGKTFLAMGIAIAALQRREVKRVILCRPAVEAGEKLGFLPGDMAEKVNPYLRPLYDALYEMVDGERAKDFIERGMIEVAPLAFMRGRTLTNAFVILDEAQNTTPGQMKMFLTRIGHGSKCFVTGDVTQIDLPRGINSGLLNAMHVLKGVEGISFIHFTRNDVIRHPLVAKIVDAYDRKPSND